MANQGAHFVYSDCAFFKDKPDKDGSRADLPFQERMGWTSYRVESPMDEGQTLVANNSFPPTAQAMRSILFSPDHLRGWWKNSYKNVGGHDRELKVGDDHDLCQRFYLEYGQYKGSLVDVKASIEWSPIDHFAIGVGLESFNLGLEAEGDGDFPGIDFHGEIGFEYVGDHAADHPHQGPDLPGDHHRGAGRAPQRPDPRDLECTAAGHRTEDRFHGGHGRTPEPLWLRVDATLSSPRDHRG